MKITLRDVALASGVSAMAVSKVLHGTGASVRVSETTAQKIRAAAKELSYRPNTIARSLRSRRTNMIGVVFDHLERFPDENPYHSHLLNGIMTALFPNDYTLALCPKLIQSGSQDAMDDGRFDGVLWARPDFGDALVGDLSELKVPIVMMHAPPGSIRGVSTFSVDNEIALRLSVNHLAELGHRQLAFVLDSINDHTAEGRARANAFLSACHQLELSGQIWVWDESPLSMAAFAADHPEITGLTVFSDTLAGQLLIVCRDLGIRVPEDLSVIGFDSSTFCERTHPTLTSIHQSVERIAFDAATHLLALIQQAESDIVDIDPVSRIYDCRLDVRDSTALPSQWKKTHELQI